VLRPRRERPSRRRAADKGDELAANLEPAHPHALLKSSKIAQTP